MNYLIKDNLYPSNIFQKFGEGGTITPDSKPLNFGNPGTSKTNTTNPDNFDLSVEQFVSMLPESIKQKAMSKPEILNKVYHQQRAKFNSELAKELDQYIKSNRVTNKRKLANDLYVKKLQSLKNQLNKGQL